MQINNVQSFQNFGSLKYDKTPEMKAKMNELPMETIEKIQNAVRILGREGDTNATKFYHVRINNDLSCSLEAEEGAYFGTFRNSEYQGIHSEKQDNVLMVKNINGCDKAGVAKYQPIGETEFFRVWGFANTSYDNINHIESLAKIAKILDDVAAEKYSQQVEQEAAKQDERQRVAEAVNQLFA